MQHILMLSQDHAYQNALTSLLREQGFPLSSARTVEDALDQLYSKRIDLLIADLESWKEKGIAVYRQIRQELGGKELSSIIIASLEVMQEIKFSLSFDDFVVKNDDPAEVLLRIRQLLWRQSRLDTENIVKIEDLIIDLNNYDVVNGGKKVYLTYKEYELLKCLVLNRGKVFTREILLDKVDIVSDQLGQWVYPFHRLDRATSGVLLFALDQETARRMTQSFTDGAVSKSYLAVVRGFTEESGRIEHRLKEIADRMDGWSADQDRPGKDAVTEYRRSAPVELPLVIGRYATARYSLIGGFSAYRTQPPDTETPEAYLSPRHRRHDPWRR